MNVFNPVIYKLLNFDLLNLTTTQAQNHYYKHGILEGRPYSIRCVYNDFRSDYYKALNPDLKMNDLELQIHWLKRGRFENRKFKPQINKEHIILYFDEKNEETKINAQKFSQLLTNLNIPNIVSSNQYLNTDHFYMLFSINNIKFFPFYFILNLENYNINNVILELSSALCINQQDFSSHLKQYSSKSYFINSNNTNITNEYLIKRLLIGVECCDMCILNLDVLDVSKIHVLTLLETRERTNAFIENTNTNINYQMIYGLKHAVPYIGCAMSYKFIIQNAKKQNLPYIIICEDDTLFSSDFNEKLKIILDYLENNKSSWDMFVGIMESVSADTKVSYKVKLERNIELCKISHFSSMVFNIYNSSVYDKVLSWNPYLRSLDNQIDGYLNKLNLNILTVRPFLVNYNTKLNSTIWKNRPNNISQNSIQDSNNKIKML
jgi:GR25 family glycosyltransferase involved in LPS biosynthesis